MPTTDELLQQLLAETTRTRRAVEALALHLGAGRKPAEAGGASPSGGRGAVASDRDLDGRYGDPDVRFDPRSWEGESFKSCRFSECPPEFLDELAEVLDDFADKETDEKKRGYKRSDAAKARGWSRRKRAASQQGGASEDFA